MNLPGLNLLNFEHPRAKKCKYILTSPRSLKACRKAGIKPVELLCKSISDVEKETENKDEAYIIYQANEKERQRKLSICRAIRNQFLLFGYPDSKHKRHSPKMYTYKDRLLPVLTDNVMRNNTSTPENKRPSSTTHKMPKVDTLSEAPERSRMCLPVPKMNMTYEGKTDKSESWKITSKELKVNLPAKSPQEAVSTEKKTIQVHPQTYQEEKAKNQNINNADFDLMKNPSYDKLSREILGKENKILGQILKENDSEITICEDVNNNYNYCDEKHNCSGRRNKESKKYKKSSEYKNLFQFMKMEYADPLYCVQKYKKVIENSVDRELRELEVHRVQRELEEGMERWQDRVLLLQWVDLTRAGEQASRELELKMERAHQKNRSKNIIHTININRVKEAEDMKAEGLRKQVQDKERKILNLHEEKKRVIFESKSRAQSVTELKDHIRSIMTPETFDRKVAKLGMEKKVLNSRMCPRVMQTSHIWLG